MTKQTIVSGAQPTGNLHVGNYLGAVKNWVDLQNSGKYEMYIFIADLHSLTGNMDADTRREQIMRTAAELLALGIDPKKTILFVQSHIQEHAELGWIFNCVTQLGELRRMTQFKDKSGVSVGDIYWRQEKAKMIEEWKKERHLNTIEEELENAYKIIIDAKNKMEEKSNAGLLTYPVLQAADILLYHGNLVPVGQDQVQHVELTRDIARWFNNRFGNYFPEAKALLTKVPKVMSLLDPNKKMSKSLGLGHVIELCDEPEVIEKKLRKAVTATVGGGEALGVKNLLMLLHHFGEHDVYSNLEQLERLSKISYSDLKQAVGDAMGKYFADFRAKRKALLADTKKLNDILASGADKAKPVAEKTMKDVRGLIGI